jgi:quinoprotein glucose dehydrogenase
MTHPAPTVRFRVLAALAAVGFPLVAASCASGDPEPAGVTPVSDAAAAADVSTEMVMEGVFTASQAERGAEVYDDVCLECHTRVEFKEDAFLFAWEGSSVATLLSYLQESMPDDAPGTLPAGSYTDVTAYILEMNGWEAGSRELRGDDEMLSELTFQAR